MQCLWFPYLATLIYQKSNDTELIRPSCICHCHTKFELTTYHLFVCWPNPNPNPNPIMFVCWPVLPSFPVSDHWLRVIVHGVHAVLASMRFATISIQEIQHYQSINQSGYVNSELWPESLPIMTILPWKTNACSLPSFKTNIENLQPRYFKHLMCLFYRTIFCCKGLTLDLVFSTQNAESDCCICFHKV